MTLSNGDIRTVGNLSRDWSQTFVDVCAFPGSSAGTRAAGAGCRGQRSCATMPAWSQALVDGPRILGLQSLRPERIDGAAAGAHRALPARRCFARIAPPDST